MKIFGSQNYGGRENGYLHDTPINQFLIDPIFTGLIGLFYSQIYNVVNNVEIKEFPYLLASTRLLSSVVYNIIADKNENKISRFFRDYILPPVLAAATGYLYGLATEQNVTLAAVLITIFSELMTDVVERRVERRIEK